MNQLNTRQHYAVTRPFQPTLVVAGAGTGKTAVLTHRVAWLIEQGIPERQIFVATFTNKAANEMRERIAKILGRSIRPLWIGTFHSLCVKILRRHLPDEFQRFSILDKSDSTKLAKQCVHELDMENYHKPAAVVRRISSLKSNLITVSIAEATATSSYDQEILQLYELYEEKIQRMRGLDFDDLILRAVQAMHNGLTMDFQAVLVDEYQDINLAQRELTIQLASPSMNVFAVGDPSQSIYKFRGTDLAHTLEFEQDYPGTEIVKLERNYRSSGNILNASNCLIANNPDPYEKRLDTEAPDGPPIHTKRCSDTEAEAEYIATHIPEDGQTAILYRTNIQGAEIGLALSRHGVPHEIVANTQFYERKEIRDILAYMHIIHNQANSIALERIINTPPRGIGKKTLRTLQAHAKTHKRTLIGAARTADQTDLGTRSLNAIQSLVTMVEELVTRSQGLSPDLIINIIMNVTGYAVYLDCMDSSVSSSMKQNISMLRQIAAGYRTLDAFLEDAQLMSDVDGMSERSKVLLMTVHTAKGLEFDHVIIAGAEDGLFPHHRHMHNAEAVEEERRLFYVAMTRAKKTLLIISRPGVFRTYGASRFLREIPGNLKHERTVISEWRELYS